MMPPSSNAWCVARGREVDVLVREIDLPWLPFRELSPGQQSTLKVIKHRL